MLKVKSVIFCSLVLGSFAHAQTKAPSTKAPVKASSAKTASVENAFLDSLRLKATQDFDRVSALLKIEINRAEGYNVCKVNELTAQKKYDRWFLDHYEQFATMTQKIDSVIDAANVKLESIKSQTISVLPVKGQNSPEIQVSVANLIDYFKIYNGRIKTCDKDKMNELSKHMEDPEKNSLNIAHSQVVAAMGKMTENLNATLQEPNASYVLSFKPATCGYELQLQAVIDFNGSKRTYDFSLLNSSGNDSSKMKLDDSALWPDLIRSGTQLDQMPMDALKRYKVFIDQEMGDCKAELSVSKKFASESLFLSYTELKEMVAAKAKEVSSVVVAGKTVLCTELAGTFKSTKSGHTVTISDACDVTSVDVGGEWPVGSRVASRDENVIHVTWDTNYFLSFTFTSVDTLDYVNVTHGGKLVFKRVK